MEILKKRLLLEGSSYYVKHLEIINPMLPQQMTNKEIEVMGNFMSLEGETAELDRFGTTCRKIIKSRLKLSDGGLGNYIKSLKIKGLILSREDTLFIPKFLWCNKNGQGYMFRLDRDLNGVPKPVQKIEREPDNLSSIPVIEKPEEIKDIDSPEVEDSERPYRLKD